MLCGGASGELIDELENLEKLCNSAATSKQMKGAHNRQVAVVLSETRTKNENQTRLQWLVGWLCLAASVLEHVAGPAEAQ